MKEGEKQFAHKGGTQMQNVRATCATFTLTLLLFSLATLIVPEPGITQNPQPCPNWTGHLGGNLGNKASYLFQFHKNCPGYWSSAITWQFLVQDNRFVNKPILCTSGGSQIPVPPNGQGTLNCPSLPTGCANCLIVVVNFTVPPNNPMTHTHTISNY